jgi:hypothetical protein
LEVYLDAINQKLLLTIYQINENKNQIERIRYYPREISTNAVKVQVVLEVQVKNLYQSLL